MRFAVVPFRFVLEARDAISFTSGEETNVFRGSFGAALRRIAPDIYSKVFEPQWTDGPSGYRAAPRPFVLRWPQQPRHFEPGSHFTLLFNCFAPEIQANTFYDAFQLAAEMGLGRTRATARLNSAIDDIPVLDLPTDSPHGEGRLRVQFVTPTELKADGSITIEAPAFAVLMRRLAERIWILGRLYQGWQSWDYEAMLESAPTVQLTKYEWQRVAAFRTSGRTRQRHSIGGFIGWADYDGSIGASENLLQIASWTGVGRQTAWGKGEIRAERLD